MSQSLSLPVVDGNRCTRCALALLVLSLLPIGAIAQLGPPPEPAGNPVTVEKANLGKALFWDEQLASTRTVACGTCHFPSAGGSDPRSLNSPLAIHPGANGLFGGDDDVMGSPGVPLSDADGTYLSSPLFGLTEQATGRRSMSAINAGYSAELFWDGRAANEFVDPDGGGVVLASGAALESQAVGPLVSDVEMAHVGRTWPEVLARIDASEPLALATNTPAELLDWVAGRDYAALFEEAFGSPGITAPRVGMAIASYERTLVANQAPFDEFLAGGDVLTPLEVTGRGVFLSSSCDRCHSVEIMSDHLFHFTGVRPHSDDLGRFDVTGVADDSGKMRTPSLRNVELRAPYMRNGRFGTLEEVVEFYNRGGDFEEANKDPLVRPLMLSQAEKDALVAFLSRPLTDPRLIDEQPPFDRPKLYTESERVPAISGASLPGTGNFVPEVVALEPALLGNPSFTIGVYNGLGGAAALLVIDAADPGLTVPASGAFAFENVVLGGAAAGEGFGSVNLVIPTDPLLVGSEWFGRWYVTDTGGGGVAAVSRLFQFTIFDANQGGLFSDGFESGNGSRWSTQVP